MKSLKRFVSRGTAVIGSALCTVSLHAQNATQTASPPNGTGSVAGIVFDSLSRKPMAQATVRIQGSDFTTTADAAGRFIFESVPAGSHLLTFSSAALESSGLRSAGVAAEVVAGQRSNVSLGTPSLRRLWEVLCRGRTLVGMDSGIVTGTVVDGDRNVRLRKAPTAMSWFNLKSAGNYGVFPEVRVQVETDSLGAYIACGVPTDVSISAKSFGDDAATGEVKYFVGPLFIRRVDMVVTKALALGGLARGTATLRGIVKDSSGRPVADATVRAPAADTSTRTGADGSFVLRGLAAGSQSLEIRKVGFGMATPNVTLRADLESTTSVVMSGVTMLDTYAVRGERASFEIGELEQRQKMGFGTIVDFTKTQPQGPLTPLSTMPRVRVSFPNTREMVTITDPMTLKKKDTLMLRHEATVWMSSGGGGRRCRAELYLDGSRADAEVMSAFPVNQIAAMEVYTTASTIPARFYRPFVNDTLGDCGVVLYWTKAAMQR